jgi:lipocalin
LRVLLQGFWLFSRKPVDPEGTAIMRAKAVALGLDLSPLVKVAQEGCKYAGA